MNKFFVIIGPSGSGKTTLIDSIFSFDQKIISYTSRKKRPGEKNNIDYYFRTKAEIKDKFNKKEILELAEYDNEYYGYDINDVMNVLKHKNAVKAITKDGYDVLMSSSIRDFIVPIFLKINKEQLIENFKGRKENAVQKQSRISLFEKDASQESFFKERGYILEVKNDKNITIQNFKSIIKKETN